MLDVSGILNSVGYYSICFDTLTEITEYINKPKIQNCINCGAPLTSHKCEYCGTVY